jgi:mRNA interferase RelE/StbE
VLKFDFKKPAYDFLIDLQPKPFKQVMLTIIRLTKTPYPHDSQKLTGYPSHRIDIGEYRVIYDVEAETVRVIVVGKRNDDEVYRRLRTLCS